MEAVIQLLGLPDAAAFVFLTLVYGIAAVLSGLTGFGFSAIGALSLMVLPPNVAVAQLMTLSLITQSYSCQSLWPEMRQHFSSAPWRKGVQPYLTGGLLGMPVGLLILATADARSLTVGLGLFLLGYAAWSGWMPAAAAFRREFRPAWQPMLVGATAGVVGGFSASPGAILAVWHGLIGTGKVQARAMTQLYILTMQVAGLALSLIAQPELLGRRYWMAVLVFLPFALAGNMLGVHIYRRTGDLGYRRITLIALAITGAVLVLKAALN